MYVCTGSDKMDRNRSLTLIVTWCSLYIITIHTAEIPIDMAKDMSNLLNSIANEDGMAHSHLQVTMYTCTYVYN